MNPAALPPEVWEALCRRCGKCCAEKLEMGGTVYITRKMCRFLDTKTRRCQVYSDRFHAEPECASAYEGLPKRIFPADCPYTKGIEGYRAPVEEWDDPEVDDAVREVFGDDALPSRDGFEV